MINNQFLCFECVSRLVIDDNLRTDHTKIPGISEKVTRLSFVTAINLEGVVLCFFKTKFAPATIGYFIWLGRFSLTYQTEHKTKAFMLFVCFDCLVCFFLEETNTY